MPKFGPKTQQLSFNLIPLIMSLVHMAEVLYGKGTGAEKKAAVLEGVKQAAMVGVAAVEANNPKQAAAIDAAITIAAGALYPSGTTAPQP